MSHEIRLMEPRSAFRYAFYSLAGLLLFAHQVTCAQQMSNPTGKLIPPEGPLLQKHAPATASWIVIQGAPVSVKELSQPASNNSKKTNSSTTQKTTFVKADGIMHAEIIQDEKHTWNIWIKGDLQVVVWPDGKNLGFANKPTGSTDFNPLYIDLSDSDFPGFDWISAENYTGMGTLGGKSCLTFKSSPPVSPSPAPGNGLSTEATAYVDLETRLPVALTNRFGVRMYQFMSTPAGAGVMPADVQAFIDQEKQKRQSLSRRPSAPY